MGLSFNTTDDDVLCDENGKPDWGKTIEFPASLLFTPLGDEPIPPNERKTMEVISS
jgi:hypothetical protein